jgi:hypothetical protein
LGHFATISAAQVTIPSDLADSYVTLLETFRRTLARIEEGKAEQRRVPHMFYVYVKYMAFGDLF